jgi:hypothetical protein
LRSVSGKGAVLRHAARCWSAAISAAHDKHHVVRVRFVLDSASWIRAAPDAPDNGTMGNAARSLHEPCW